MLHGNVFIKIIQFLNCRGYCILLDISYFLLESVHIFLFYCIEHNDINDMPLDMKPRMVQELEVEDSGMLRESAYINVNIPVSYTHLTLPTNREV